MKKKRLRQPPWDLRHVYPDLVAALEKLPSRKGGSLPLSVLMDLIQDEAAALCAVEAIVGVWLDQNGESDRPGAVCGLLAVFTLGVWLAQIGTARVPA